jgi:ABC-type phosphate/phosphonate transport system substrate-binding protein
MENQQGAHVFKPVKTLVYRAAGAVVLGTLTCASALAASPAEQLMSRNKAMAQKTAFIPPAGMANSRAAIGNAVHELSTGEGVLVFSAPPRESEEDAMRTYQPIAEYLSRVIGKTVIYKRPSDWLTYQTEMQRGQYDIVFDGPHFNSWRISNIHHSALVKLADELAFVVVVRKDDKITDIKQLVGQKVCGMNPPNLGTLAVLGQFDNPMRQPYIMNSQDWSKAYEGVAFEKKCAAAIVPIANFRKFPDSASLTRVIYQTRSLPNQAFSAGPRISPSDQARIASALVSRESGSAMSHLMAANGSEKGLAYASKEEYAGYDAYLKDSWSYKR